MSLTKLYFDNYFNTPFLFKLFCRKLLMDKRKRSFLWDQILKGVQVPNSLVLQVRNLIDSGNKRHFLGKKITKKILIKNQIISITYSNCIVFNLHSLAIINRQRNRSRSCVVGNFCILFSHAISSTF